MNVSYSPEGILIPQLDLWLDPREGREAAWLSHAHGDHARGAHQLAFGTAATAQIYEIRWGASLAPDSERRAVPFGEPWEFRGARLTAQPAGHILGAAQLLIEHQGERLVYTGDIKLRPPMLGRTTEIVPCDHLIIESTFGLPVYRFLSREQAAERIVRCAREAFSEGLSPVFIGYPLGRGQEVLHALCQAGIPAVVHGSIARYIPVYEEWGFQFDGWEPYQPSLGFEGKAAVVTPGFQNYLQASGKKVRLVYVSGWASLSNARARTGCEELIPYSDHGDFEELLAIVQQSGARRVDVVHGYAEPFARILCGMGIDARAPHSLAAREEAEEA